MVNGTIAAIRHDYENFSCHHFLWLQGAGRHIRTVHGNWGLLREDGWYLGSDSPRIVPACKVLRRLRARCTMHYPGHLRFPRCRSSSQWYHAHNSLGRGYNVRTDWCLDVHTTDNGEFETLSVPEVVKS